MDRNEDEPFTVALDTLMAAARDEAPNSIVHQAAETHVANRPADDTHELEHADTSATRQAGQQTRADKTGQEETESRRAKQHVSVHRHGADCHHGSEQQLRTPENQR